MIKFIKKWYYGCQCNIPRLLVYDNYNIECCKCHNIYKLNSKQKILFVLSNLYNQEIINNWTFYATYYYESCDLNMIYKLIPKKYLKLSEIQLYIKLL